jgi:ABC-type multidrug transport system fused ATPase/permease subunit
MPQRDEILAPERGARRIGVKLSDSSRSAKPLSDSVWLPAVALLVRDFAAFAGRRGLLALFLVFAGALVESVGLLLLIPFFAVVIDSSSTSLVQRHASAVFELLSLDTRSAKLALIVATFTILMIARGFIITAREALLAELGLGFIHALRSRLAHRLASARWDVVARLRHSRLTHIMSAGLEQVDAAARTLLRDAVALVMLVTQVFLAFVLAPWLATLALLVTTLGIAALLPSIKRARFIGVLTHHGNLSLIENVSQFLGALKLAASQNLQGSFISELEATLSALRTQQVSYARKQGSANATIATVTAFIAVLMIVVGILVFDAPPSVLITLLFLFARMNAPATQLQRDAQFLSGILPSYEAVLELETELIAAEERTVATLLEHAKAPQGAIVFDRVSFAHGSEPSTNPGPSATAHERVSAEAGGIRDLTLRIEEGSVLGVTGPSGAGKTTFADLLVGLYPPQAGTIRIGDVALVGPALASWRNRVSYVAQDTFLFHDTIRRNLLWSAPNADDETLWDALRLVEADKVLQRIKNGLETVVGERGTLLSGGERQRIALARAILRQPRLLVLDEATNALDIQSEQVLFEKLLAIRPRPTIVIIAHRNESLAPCERLILLDGGKLVSDVTAKPSHL